MEVAASNQDWAVIDEVQRVPQLLNEAHRAIENLGQKFALSGSSARKLRRPNVNLLAGRALIKTMFPLTSHELDLDFDMERHFSSVRYPPRSIQYFPRNIYVAMRTTISFRRSKLKHRLES